MKFFVPMSLFCPYHNREIGTVVSLYTSITYIYLSLCPYLFPISNKITDKTTMRVVEMIDEYIPSRACACTRARGKWGQQGQDLHKRFSANDLSSKTQ